MSTPTRWLDIDHSHVCSDYCVRWIRRIWIVPVGIELIENRALWINSGRAFPWICRFNVSQQIIWLVFPSSIWNWGGATTSGRPKPRVTFGKVSYSKICQVTNGLKAFDLERSRVRRESWERISAQKHFRVGYNTILFSINFQVQKQQSVNAWL